MKLLVVTQAIDKNSPVLGFFHRWVEKFSERCDVVTVICLEKGEHNLPQNVKVLSLGKEKKDLETTNYKLWNKVKYAFKFFQYVWMLRNDYDSVFVHMNQEYVLLGGLIWKLFRKRIYFWRNHRDGNFLTQLSILISDKVFCTSKHSFTARFKKTKIMPVGIDTDIFSPDEKVKKDIDFLMLGRIAPVKNIHIFAEVLLLLDKRGLNFKAIIIGDVLPKDKNYMDAIKKTLNNLVISGKVEFKPAIPNHKAVDFYRRSRFFINLTPSGSFDKTIIEAMACGCLVITSNDSVFDILQKDKQIVSNNFEMIAKKVEELFSLEYEKSKNEASSFRQYSIEKHSLKELMNQLFLEMK